MLPQQPFCQEKPPKVQSMYCSHLIVQLRGLEITFSVVSKVAYISIQFPTNDCTSSSGKAKQRQLTPTNLSGTR